MHICYRTNQTILALELSSCLPSSYAVFTIEKVSTEMSDEQFTLFHHALSRSSYLPKMLLAILLFIYL
ncbi:hypothetical protein [Streptococcus dentiloxodontae]